MKPAAKLPRRAVVCISDYRFQPAESPARAPRTKLGKFKADVHKALAEFAALVDAAHRMAQKSGISRSWTT